MGIILEVQVLKIKLLCETAWIQTKSFEPMRFIYVGFGWIGSCSLRIL